MCCVLGQNALLSQRLSAPRSRNENLMKCQGSNFGMDWLPIQGGVLIPLVASLDRNWDKLELNGLLGSSTDCAIIIRPYCGGVRTRI